MLVGGGGVGGRINLEENQGSSTPKIRVSVTSVGRDICDEEEPGWVSDLQGAISYLGGGYIPTMC